MRGIRGEIITGTGENALYIDDAAERMEQLSKVMPGSVSLIYMDPPFRTGKQFGLKLSLSADKRQHGKADVALPAYADALPREEYLALLMRVLVAARELLTEDGLIFIHVDYREHAHIRLLADEVFGEERFINEIIWAYESGGRSKNFFARKHDILLLYAKGEQYDLHIQDVAETLKGDKKNHMSRGVDEDGRTYRFITVSGKTYRYYDDEPIPPSDVWTDISHLQQRDPQRTGYPTQKPLKLLERVVKCASRPGDTVLDPFCGSGTTLEAALRNGRNFIGIDMNPQSVEIVRSRIAGAACSMYYPENEAFGQINVERVVGITFESIYLNAFAPCDLPEGYALNGLDAVDSWAVGTVENGIFRCVEEARRSRKTNELASELHLPMYTEHAAVRVSDLFGRRSFYSLQN